MRDHTRRGRRRGHRREVGVGQGLRPGGVVGGAVERAGEGGQQVVQLQGARPDETSKRLQCPDRIGGLGAVEPSERSTSMRSADGNDMRETRFCRYRPCGQPRYRVRNDAQRLATGPTADRVERPAQPGHDIVEPAGRRDRRHRDVVGTGRGHTGQVECIGSQSRGGQVDLGVGCCVGLAGPRRHAG